MSRREPYLRDPDRYVVKKGGGCLMLFGLPFLLAGLAVMTSPLWGEPKMEGGGPAPLYFIIPFGLIFASVGAGLVFGRSGLVLDARSRTISKWWGLLVPFKSTSFPMDKVTAVTISREVRTSRSSKGGSSTYTVYPVRLAGLGKPLDLEEPRDYGSARTRAEEVAKFLDVGIEDTSSGKKVTREAGTLDESMRDRVGRTGEELERPKEPEGCRVTTSARRGEAVFDIPPPGFGIGGIVVLAVGAAFMAVPFFMFGGFLFPLLSKSEDNGIGDAWPILIVFGVFMLVWCGGILAMIVKVAASATARDRLSVSTREIVLERRTFLGRKTKAIPTDELEELELAGPSMRGVTGGVTMIKALQQARASGRITGDPTTIAHHVVARSDRLTIDFGAGLSADELTWLRDVVKFIVTAPE